MWGHGSEKFVTSSSLKELFLSRRETKNLRNLSKSAVLFFAKGGITLQINIGPEKRKNYVFEIGIYVFVWNDDDDDNEDGGALSVS